MDQRLEQLKIWLQQSDIQFDSITPASADASFRRYFRITGVAANDNGKTETRIIMDAPPDKEDCRPFIKIATMLYELGLNVPQILQQDLQQGFLLLSDLGDTVFLSVLNNDTVEDLYRAAMQSLLLMQQKQDADLPLYSETFLRNEMALFTEWYLGKQLSITLTPGQTAVLENAFDILVNNALTQPQVLVHRDYHSRNLMINELQADKPGIIDFQDAVIGAVTYDLVSLLKDCYISWPRDKVEAWVKTFQQQAESVGIIKNVSTEEFLRWFDLMGLQRHIKVAGIFSRLKHRDGKTGYLKDIPRTMDYVFDVVARYPEFKPLQKLLGEII